VNAGMHRPCPVGLPARQDAPHRRIHSSLACDGSARAPSGHSAEYCSGATRSRCARIFVITSGSSMLAMILSWPPQRTQASISMPNTRLSRRTPSIATCRGVGGTSAAKRAMKSDDSSTICVVAVFGAAAVAGPGRAEDRWRSDDMMSFTKRS